MSSLTDRPDRTDRTDRTLSAGNERGRVLRDAVARNIRPATFALDLRPGGGTEAPSFEDGYEAGLAQGLAQGRALTEADEQAAQRRATRLAESFTRAVERVAAAEAERVERMELALLPLALELAEAIIGRELLLSASPGLDALRRAVTAAPARAELVARLHPDDVATLPPPSALAQVLRVDGDVRVVADASLEPGDCVLIAGDCEVDARLTSAMSRARALLSGREHSFGDDDELGDGGAEGAGEVNPSWRLAS